MIPRYRAPALHPARDGALPSGSTIFRFLGDLTVGCRSVKAAVLVRIQPEEPVSCPQGVTEYEYAASNGRGSRCDWLHAA